MQVFTSESCEDLSLLLGVLSECENVNGIKIIGFSYYFVNEKLFSVLLSSGSTTICIIINEMTTIHIVKVFEDPTWMKIGFNINDFMIYLKNENISSSNVLDIKNLLYSLDLKLQEEMVTFDSLCEKFFDYCSETDGNDAYKILYIFKSINEASSEFLKKKFVKKPIISRNSARVVTREYVNKNAKIQKVLY